MSSAGSIPGKLIKIIAGLCVVIALAFIIHAYLKGTLFGNGADETVSFLQLTSQPGPEYFPSLSPAENTFVYSARTEGNWDIMLAKVGGRIPMNLTRDCPDDDTQPAFSPDGKLIAFRSERNGGGIFVMHATTNAVQQVTDFGYNPAWSPDGRKILLAGESITRPEDRAATGSGLWIADYPRGERRLLYKGDAVQPQWSPHGKRIAFWAIDTGGGRNVWTIPAQIPEGASPQPVRVTTGSINWNPVWSATGDALYFSSDRSGNMNLYCVPMDEETGKVLGQPELVSTPSADSSHISVAPNGGRLAYVQYSFTANLYKVPFDSVSELARGEPLAITHGSRQATRPSLSPDGKWLAFNTWAKQEDLFVVGTDGIGLRELTNDVYQDRGPRWSPDGKKLAFFSNRSGKYEAWTIDFEGTGLRRITNYPEHMVVSPFWSPDGKGIAGSIYGIRSFLMDFRKKVEVPLDIHLDQFGGYFQAWSWSKTGSMIAGQLINPDGSEAGIGIYHVASNKFERLTRYGMDPVWLSDDRRLLFSHDGGIDLLDSRTGRTHPVLSVAPQSVAKRGFAVSADDRLIYFSQTTTEADVWLLRRERGGR